VTVSEVLLENAIPADSNAANQSISNPKIKFAELNYQSIRKDTRLERANNLPTLTTYYGFSTFYYKPLNQPNAVVADFNQQISDNKNHQLGIQLNVPVFNGFRNNKRISAAKIESEKSQYDIAQEKLKVDNQIALENQNRNNYQKLFAKLQETKTYAEASFRTSQAKFSSGVIDAIVFSSVKNQWLNAEYDLLKNQLQQQYVDLKINLLNGNIF